MNTPNQVNDMETRLRDGAEEILNIAQDQDALTRIRRALVDDSLDAKQLSLLFPQRLWGLAVSLRTPSISASLIQQSHPDVSAVLQRAKEFVNSELVDLFKHPAFLEEITEQTHGPSEQDSSNALRTVSSVACLPSWIGPSPNFRPAVRLVFRDAEEVILFDSTNLWDDLAHIAGALVAILADEMTNGQELVNRIELSEQEKSVISSNIRGIRDRLEAIERLAGIYGISIEPQT